ncbi:MAG: LysR family transcriptional regulator [Fusobacterium sp. JB021]|nr:LysR family transcriptional regulator [Fusobacterium sp. JB020]MDP0493691.1 LysR family transcriptional regulator [Fusobacterium sp. JB021]MDP0507487.1 LysR family transcriptional regulator [Fusobacterium sp. JB019]
MDLHYLKIFYEVAKEKSFTKAANKLFINQSAVSIQVKKFEEILNTKLFDRSSKKIRLTYTGEALYKMAEDIFNKVQRTEKEINRIIKLGKAKIIIGSTSIIGDPLLPRLMEEFGQSHNEIEYEIKISEKNILLKELKEGEIDIALVDEEHIIDPNLDVITVEKVPYVLITSNKDISIENISEYPLITRTNVPNNSKAINYLEDKYNFIFENKISVLGSLEVIKGMVKKDIANVILPYYSVSKEILNGTFKIVEELEEIKDGYQLVITKDKANLTPIIKFLNFMSHYKING